MERVKIDERAEVGAPGGLRGAIEQTLERVEALLPRHLPRLARRRLVARARRFSPEPIREQHGESKRVVWVTEGTENRHIGERLGPATADKT
jgi:hypothetical protein